MLQTGERCQTSYRSFAAIQASAPIRSDRSRVSYARLIRFSRTLRTWKSTEVSVLVVSGIGQLTKEFQELAIGFRRLFGQLMNSTKF